MIQCAHCDALMTKDEVFDCILCHAKMCATCSSLKHSVKECNKIKESYEKRDTNLHRT